MRRVFYHCAAAPGLKTLFKLTKKSFDSVRIKIGMVNIRYPG
jgi:hypothetical protein